MPLLAELEAGACCGLRGRGYGVSPLGRRVAERIALRRWWNRGGGGGAAAASGKLAAQSGDQGTDLVHLLVSSELAFALKLSQDGRSSIKVRAQRLRTHLRPLCQQGLLTFTSARDIAPGSDVAAVVDAHFASAQQQLLLISADFLALDGCYDQMVRAAERHQRGETLAIALRLQAVDPHGVPAIPLLWLPADGCPITGRLHQEPAWALVVGELRTILSAAQFGA